MYPPRLTEALSILAPCLKSSALSVAILTADYSGFVVGRAVDRHRGGGHPPTPATPPCIRVRTRRFERLR
jgi:hypothetical protein